MSGAESIVNGFLFLGLGAFLLLTRDSLVQCISEADHALYDVFRIPPPPDRVARFLGHALCQVIGIVSILAGEAILYGCISGQGPTLLHASWADLRLF